MYINFTFVGQIISFFLYMLVCKIYIWPYVVNVIEKRKKNILFKIKELENIKNKIKILNKKIKFCKLMYKNEMSKVVNDVNEKKKILLSKYKKEAISEYNNIIKEAEIKISLERRNMYLDFNKNKISIIKNILKEVTNDLFDKDLDNKYIKSILDKK